MNEAIKLAIEKGGYKLYTMNPPVIETPIEVIILDPLFWQALGKALGWKCMKSMNRGYENSDWAEAWHDYINVLAIGGDTEKFWKALTQSLSVSE